MQLESLHITQVNRINVSSRYLALTAYNENPIPLRIDGVREKHRKLFIALAIAKGIKERRKMFLGYLRSLLLTKNDNEDKKRLLREGFTRFLIGWHCDSNSAEGAMLKGWVESRFGLRPTFHRAPMISREFPAYARYEDDRARMSNGLLMALEQFDLIYEFMQDELIAQNPYEKHITLYRGVYDFSEHSIVGKFSDGRYRLTLNNLNSFTRDFERAWEFGDRVLEVPVPKTKIFFDNSLLDIEALKGEEEVMVIGGQYDVRLKMY